MALSANEKLQRFADEILGEANEAARQIREEVEHTRKQKLDKGEFDILKEVYDYITEEKKLMARELGNRRSSYNIEKRRELLLLREKIIERVTEGIKEMLSEYTAGEEYKSRLIEKCREMSEKYGTKMTVNLSRADLGLSGEIEKAVGASAKDGFEIKAEPAIEIGGAQFCVKSGQEGSAGLIVINETFDEKLARSRERIIKLIGPEMDAS